MKKTIAVLLCFAVIFAFAACTKNNEDASAATTAQPTGKPGAMVTDADGHVVTATDFGFVLDENGQPQFDENGVVMTTYGYVPATYPPAEGETLPVQTTAATVAAGNTRPSENAKWPAHDFMKKLPKLRDSVDSAVYSNTTVGQQAIISVNELSYADFLKYIETCKAAGFTQSNTGTVLPENAQAGESYIYSSNANGLYITIRYYTDEYPYRTCDLTITVADFDVLNADISYMTK